MDRFTYRHNDNWCVSGLNGKLISDKHANYWGEAINRLAYYEELEEQGRLIVLPCKIGDTVYQPSHKFTKCSAYNYEKTYIGDSYCDGCEEECDSICNPYIYVGKVTKMEVLSNGMVVVKITFDEKWDTSDYIVGLSVFLSKEEAEAALNNNRRCDCDTCRWDDMPIDEVDNPCWNCKGDYSEWSPRTH